MAWYKEWFGQEYLDLYAHRDSDEAEQHVDFVVQHLEGPAPRRVLDLACGAGRHTGALSRRGYPAVGVDLSLTLLAHPPRQPRSVAGDMRCLPFRDASFDWVLNFFTSFGYFERERENFRVLEEIVRLLSPGGRFLIDFLNRERVIQELQERETQVVDGREVHIERWYEPSTRRIQKRMRLVTPGRSPATYLESVRAYDRDEVTIGARWAGLEVDALYGNFDGDPYHRDSERLILVGHRPAF
ncbi:MAG: class I SAM-dependent methyltransferase [Holophagales bacterium]|nr:class I SAM-dependent methyltransferase [Holophagales bacterium]